VLEGFKAIALLLCFAVPGNGAGQGKDAGVNQTIVAISDRSMHIEQIDSHYLQERRSIFIYVPANAHAPMPVIYVADGLAPQVAPVIHSLAGAGLAREVIVVGIPPGPMFDRPPTPAMFIRNGELRSQEYLEGFPGGRERFAAHEQFLIREVMPLVERKWGASADRRDRAVMGQSSGAAWALSMASRHADLFSTAIALSFGWKPALTQLRKGGAIDRLYLSVGTEEPPAFPLRSRQAADLLGPRASWLRFDVTPTQHGQAAWNDRYRDALAWAFASGPHQTGAQAGSR
jgi:enterochelin esterase-like enzyme